MDDEYLTVRLRRRVLDRTDALGARIAFARTGMQASISRSEVLAKALDALEREQFPDTAAQRASWPQAPVEKPPERAGVPWIGTPVEEEVLRGLQNNGSPIAPPPKVEEARHVFDDLSRPGFLFKGNGDAAFPPGVMDERDEIPEFDHTPPPPQDPPPPAAPAPKRRKK